MPVIVYILEKVSVGSMVPIENTRTRNRVSMRNNGRMFLHRPTPYYYLEAQIIVTVKWLADDSKIVHAPSAHRVIKVAKF